MSKLESLINSLLFHQVRVGRVEALGEHFRLIELACDDPRALKFRPGDKVQLRVAPWTLRTFTPMASVSIVPEQEQGAPTGSFHVLVFHHTQSPAGNWVRALSKDDKVELFGPRKSIPLETLGGSVALFGDETSVAVAHELHGCAGEHRSYLETDHPDELRGVLHRLQMSATTVVPRQAGGEHLRGLGEQLRSWPGSVVFTGSATSIQSLRKQLAADNRRIAKTKAYWSLGKAGLD